MNCNITESRRASIGNTYVHTCAFARMVFHYVAEQSGLFDGALDDCCLSQSVCFELRRATLDTHVVAALLPEDIGGREEAFGDKHRIPSVPLLPLELHHKARLLLLVFLLYSVVSYHPKRYGGYVQRVRYEVDHVPHVVHVLLQTHVPQLFHLRPDQPGHPSQYEPTACHIAVIPIRSLGLPAREKYWSVSLNATISSSAKPSRFDRCYEFVRNSLAVHFSLSFLSPPR